MNWISLNGIKSDTINGLLIQELPPISKPLMRTEIEQIDGRDGDIVTNLGYSAYDKSMTIGLYGNYDIDDVIAYFASSGTVTFSNEPDKYYNYQVIQQIDFERLVRFRTATVTFHVQPFKYSVVGDDITASAEQWDGLHDTSITKNGVTVAASGGNITISGTASAAAEIYLPINPITLSAGGYTLSLTTEGSGASACPTRLIGSVPSNADTFGGNYVTPANNSTVTQTATLTASKTFNYLWFYISAGVAINLTLNVSLIANSLTSMMVTNIGNTFARPTFQILGSGTIDLSINGNQVLTLSLGENEYITIDAAEMNAYFGDVLLNRLVTGDYSDVVLQKGTNVISWDGSIQTIEATHVSRWI